MKEVWELERVLEEFYKIYNEKRQKKPSMAKMCSANRIEKI